MSATATPASPAESAPRRCPPPARSFYTACASCRRSGARRCTPSTPSAAPSTTSPTTAARGRRPAAELDRWRADIDALYAGRPRAAGAATSSCRCRRYGLQREDFQAVIDGMAMDAVEDIVAPDEATLDLYCDRVASAVGRLSVRIFGMPEADGIRPRPPPRPGAAAHQHPARHRRGRRARPPLPAAREAGSAIGLADPTPADGHRPSAHRRGLRRRRRARPRTITAATWGSSRRSPRKATKAARLMAAAYRLYLDARAGTRLGDAARPGRSPASSRCSASSSATASL